MVELTEGQAWSQNSSIGHSAQIEYQRVLDLYERDLVSAGAAAQDLADRNPGNFDIQMLNVDLHRRQRRFAEMKGVLSVADRLRPKDSSVYFNKGIAEIELGNLEEALDYFVSSHDYAITDKVESLIMAGKCSHRLGRPRKALVYFHKVLGRYPENVQALVGSMFALRECGRFAEADRVVHRLMKHFQANQQSKNMYLHTNLYFGQPGWRRLDNKIVQKRAISKFIEENGEDAFPWFPETFVMPDGIAELEKSHNDNPGWWLVKPASLFGGHGICIVDNPAHAANRTDVVVQRYVKNPLLVRGRNATIRLYILFTSIEPPRVYLYREGMVRFAPKPYSDDDPRDKSRHIATRRAFEAVEDLRQELTGAIESSLPIWPLSRMLREVRAQGADLERTAKQLRALVEGFANIVLSTGELRQKIAHGVRYAYGPKVIGLDIMLDQNLRPWLLEMEHSPGPWAMVSATSGKILDNLIDMTVFPLLETGKDHAAEQGHLGEAAACERQISEIEFERRGGFEPVAVGG